MNFFVKRWINLRTVGIICEYNPLHLGHWKQLRRVREVFGADCGIVCAMSGNYVQRGAPAIVDKSCRAQAAIWCGADLVLELPLTTALSSAEGFAAGGVDILSRMCQVLCFGAETGQRESLERTAQALLGADFPPLLRRELDTGKSFPAARQAALEALGLPGALLSQPNDLLAVEYCKAILAQGAALEPFPIPRTGSYHGAEPAGADSSATAVRRLMVTGGDWRSCVPPQTWPLLEKAPLHTLEAGERAILARLRAMSEADFQALPYGSEGLWRRLFHAVRREAGLEEILTAVKTKRYTRTRLDRMVLCAFLGITAQTLAEPAPYVRVLAFSERGRGILKTAREKGVFLNAGQAAEGPYWALEKRAGDLYGLFCTAGVELPGAEERRRVCCCETQEKL